MEQSICEFFKVAGQDPEAPYSSAAKCGNVIWTCGQLGTDSDGNLGATFVEQVNLAFDNLETALKEAGADLSSLIKISAFVLDINQLDTFNEVYRKRINMDSPPVRTTVQIAAFQKDILVEIDGVAYVR